MSPIDSAASTGFVKRVRTFTHIVSPPVIFAVLGLALALYQQPSLSGFAWGTLYGLLISLTPILYVVWLLHNGRIGDINMTRSERHRPYLIAVACAVVAAVVISVGGGPRYLFHLALLNIIALSGMSLINLVWQISHHATAIVAATWVAWVVFDRWIGLLLVPLVIGTCAARIYLRRHTPTQIAAGLTLGSMAVLMLLLTGCFSG